MTFNNEYRRIFTGWMYAASPDLSGVEHAIYDVWLTECKGRTGVIIDPKEPDPGTAGSRGAPSTQRAGAIPTSCRLPASHCPPGTPLAPPSGRIDVEPPRAVPGATAAAEPTFLPDNLEARPRSDRRQLGGRTFPHSASTSRPLTGVLAGQLCRSPSLALRII